MKKHYIIPILIIFIIIPLIVVLTSNSTDSICVGDKKCFSVEIAKTDEEKRIGLSNRDFLPGNRGMLFVFDEEVVAGFWMKDMRFPLDIIWINSNHEIVGIEKNLSPCSENDCPVFYSPEEISYVLEINAGLSENYGFEGGDFVEIE